MNLVFDNCENILRRRGEIELVVSILESFGFCDKKMNILTEDGLAIQFNAYIQQDDVWLDASVFVGKDEITCNVDRLYCSDGISYEALKDIVMSAIDRKLYEKRVHRGTEKNDGENF